MIPRRLSELAPIVGGTLVAHGSDTVIDAIMTDSRVTPDVGAYALFVALRTASADGHDHLRSARTAGAVAALVGRADPSIEIPQLVVGDPWKALGMLAEHDLRSSGARVVAITGSFGKTTTKDLAAAALAVERRVVSSRASFNNELGVPLTMLSVEAGTEVLVAEVGARNAGDLDAMAALLRPDVAVVTAVGPVHLETFGDEDGVAREKARLVAALRSGGIAVLNGDDPRVRAMRPNGDVLHVSATGGPGDLVAGSVGVDGTGRVRAEVTTPWGATELALPLPGRHHLTNAMLALAVAGVEGVAPAAAARGIAAATTSASRASLHVVEGVTVLDDSYNASAPTVVGAIGTLADLDVSGRRWAVLGHMAELGSTTQEQHRSVGAACVGSVDRLVVVGTEAQAIAEGARAAGFDPAALCEVADRAQASDLLAGVHGPVAGDAVLLKASRVVGLDRVAVVLLDALRARGAAMIVDGSRQP
jgi:UDP-N-acetylmuramoyl-tripeptide--D-alanyl-D-alanine ligase